MKFTRFTLGMALALLSTAAIAQSDAQKAFEQLKTLDGVWQGPATTIPPMPQMQGDIMKVSLRTTSLGNALMHEMTSPKRPDDPITMFYLDGDQLLLTHYCDAGNRPRMTGKASPDGKTVEFDFVDLAGSTEHGHMHHAKFTLIDADHHSEEWTYMMGDQAVKAHFDLQRAK
jgi:hypothetical protein